MSLTKKQRECLRLLMDGEWLAAEVGPRTADSLVRRSLVEFRGKICLITIAGVDAICEEIGWRVGPGPLAGSWCCRRALGDATHRMFGQGGNRFSSCRAYGRFETREAALEALVDLYREHGEGLEAGS